MRNPSSTIHSRRGEVDPPTNQVLIIIRGFATTPDMPPPLDAVPLDIPHHTAYGNHLSSYLIWTG